MNGRKFRRFWLTALGIPALITLILSAPFAAWALVDFPDSTWPLAFALIPLGWVFYHWLAWRRSTYTFTAGGEEIIIHKGLISRTELRVPLNFPPKATFSQGFLGRLLNFGDAEISSFGGAVTFRQIGDFRAFKNALNSQGKVLPEKEPSFLAIATIVFFVGLLKLAQFVAIGLVWLIRTSAPLLARLLRWLFGQVQSAISVVAERAESSPSIQRSSVSAFHVSYEGFLAFFADFILSDGNRALPLDCTQPDAGRRYYPTGISPDIAQIYLLILCRARIVILGTNGRSEWALREGINKIDDVRLRISHEAFDDEIAKLYPGLNRIESVTLPETKLEHKLG